MRHSRKSLRSVVQASRTTSVSYYCNVSITNSVAYSTYVVIVDDYIVIPGVQLERSKTGMWQQPFLHPTTPRLHYLLEFVKVPCRRLLTIKSHLSFCRVAIVFSTFVKLSAHIGGCCFVWNILFCKSWNFLSIWSFTFWNSPSTFFL